MPSPLQKLTEPHMTRRAPSQSRRLPTIWQALAIGILLILAGFATAAS